MSENLDLTKIDPYMLVQLIECKIRGNEVLESYREMIFADVHTDGWTENEYVLDHLRWLVEAPVEFIVEWATDTNIE